MSWQMARHRGVRAMRDQQHPWGVDSVDGVDGVGRVRPGAYRTR
jgi:hypothetical protein